MRAFYISTLLLVALTLHAADEGGTLKGTVLYNGAVPEQKYKKVPEYALIDCKCDAKGIVDERLVVDKATKGIKWAIIRIMDAKPMEAPPKPKNPYSLTVKGCVFSPHITIVAPGCDLQILNPEKAIHNYHFINYEDENPKSGVAIGSPELFVFKGQWLKAPDLIEVKCDVHGWMKAFILCHDPRYCAISDTDGTFEIKNVPPGKYKVNIWHESFGNYMKKDEHDIEIKAGVATDLGELKFGPKK